MTRTRITLEYMADGLSAPVMRWERTSEAGPQDAQTAGTFELIGRAFEVAQREEGAGIAEALAAFMRGALLRKEDIVEALARSGQP